MLRELGRLLKDSLRKEDIACRFGGEEFVLVLPDAALQDAARRAEQLREAVGRLTIAYQGRVIGPITVSLGVAAFPEHGHDARTLLQAADAALYQAEHDGRNRVSVAAFTLPRVKATCKAYMAGRRPRRRAAPLTPAFPRNEASCDRRAGA